MNLKLYAGIKVILAEPQSSLRKQYLAILKGLGCSDVIETGNMRDVCNALEEGGVDLLIGLSRPTGRKTYRAHSWYASWPIWRQPFFLSPWFWFQS